jgi:polar amino acid transport system substrate-binding protein
MRFKRFLSTALLVVLAIAPQARSQVPQLHLVSTRWPPFTNPPGEPQFALDLVNAALKRIGITADTAIVDETMFTTSLLSGKFDGSAAAWKDEEREQVMVYSEPYLENRLVLVGRRGADVSATSLSDLAGRRIVLVGGYSYGDQVTKAAGPVFLRSSGEEDSLARLLAGEADYTLMDELVVQYILNNHGDQARSRLQIGSKPLVTRTLHLAIRRERPGVEGLVNRFNAEIRRMIADRTYHRLLQLDWIQADVDGDGRVEVVPRTDQAGPLPPERTYELLLTQKERTNSEALRFYFGGNIYESWAAVPENYKTSNADRPDPARSTASVFRFTW